MQGRKVNFAKNFEKLHKDKLAMSNSALSKENERALLEKGIEQTRDGVKYFEKEIQASVEENAEIVRNIKGQQNEIVRIKEQIAELKRALPAVTREKEKARSELQISSKLLKNMEEKYATLMKEKATYLHHIENSNILKS